MADADRTARAEAQAAETAMETARRALEEAEAASLVARESDPRRGNWPRRPAQSTKVAAEAEGLAQVLEPTEGDLFHP